MYSMKQQRGMATLLLVLLVGITVMVITVGVAKNVGGQKEATVAAHAQTNAQMMAWAGVNAFQEYVKAEGTKGINYIAALNSTDKTLKSGSQEIIAKNISVTGCTSTAVTGDHCTVSADISASNSSSKAATTINLVLDMLVQGTTAVTPTPTQQKSTINFGGDTVFSGNTTIAGATPPTGVDAAEITINSSGLLTLNSGFHTQNIKTLNINATGDVTIECGVVSDCGTTVINVTSTGNVILKGGTNNFGIIKSKVGIGLYAGAEAQDLTSLGDITVSNSTAKNVISNGSVILDTGGKVDSIAAMGNVRLNAATTVNKGIESYGTVTVSGGTVGTDINAKGDVSLDTGGLVKGSITTLGAVTLYDTTTVNGNVNSAKNIVVSGSSAVLTGDAKAYDYVRLTAFGTIKGNVYAKGNVKYSSNNVYNELGSKIIGTTFIPATGSTGGLGSYGTIKKDTATVINTNFTVTPTFSTLSTFDFIAFGNQLTTGTTFNNPIDARAYINEANYIFLKTNANATQYSINRVYLNKVKNTANNVTYVADCTTTYPLSCTQSKIDETGTKSSVNKLGFSIGDYDINGTTYTGAICETVDVANQCTSSIIGYLPRISMGKSTVLGITFADDYGYGQTINRWRVSSLNNSSNMSNATLAPGIMFFDGDFEIAGNSGSNTSSAFVNSFLSTGNMWMDAYSPTIYAPYKVVENSGTVDLVCNRTLKTVTGTALTPANTLSDKYLVPTNLCKDATTFAKTMNLKADGSPDTVVIDGSNVPKLDLGKVALMSNGNINFGSCTRIFGDVLARGNLVTSRACGISDVDNPIKGNISTQGKGDGTGTGTIATSGNSIVDAIKLNLPNDSNNGGSTGSNTGSTQPTIQPTSVNLQWTKIL